MKRMLLVIALSLVPVFAQAQTVVNPSKIVFTASPDHNVVLTSGTAVLTSYELEIMAGTPTGAVAFTKGLGKPAPDGSNTITVTVPEFLTLMNGTFVGTVSAMGPGGVGVSIPSNPFDHVGKPAAPGKPTAQP